ncbi:MAG TPA: hypothetical protein VJ951_13590, partial [Bacteroidales bacterium]|nr:hypothetical protein [Bacteroidales bacterium]
TYSFSDVIHINPGETVVHGLIILILSNYVFKMSSALLDTIPFYIGVKYLSRYLHLDPNEGYRK